MASPLITERHRLFGLNATHVGNLLRSISRARVRLKPSEDIFKSRELFELYDEVWVHVMSVLRSLDLSPRTIFDNPRTNHSDVFLLFDGQLEGSEFTRSETGYEPLHVSL